MEKLYYKNPYLTEFVADIIDIIERDNSFHLVLDKTYFYPEGGGQPSDIGYIGSSPISYVYEDGGNIYHITDTKPSRLKEVKCNIDWDKRYDHMQQHLGQHILSAVLVELFNANTIGFHLSQEYSTIDIDKPITDDDFKEAEGLANKIISDNIGVQVLYPTEEELKQLPLRKLPPETDGQIRLIKIGNLDINACCGTHPNSTIEVQLIKLNKWEKHREGMRIEFLCGARAVNDYTLKHKEIRGLANLLSVNESDLLGEVDRINKELKEVNGEVRFLRNQVADFTVEKMVTDADLVNNVKVIKKIYRDVDLKYINTLTSKLLAYPNLIGLFGAENGDKAQLIFVRSRDLNIIRMDELLQDTISLIDGRGGGSPFSAQGGGKNNNNLESCLDYAYNRVKNSIP